MSDFEKTMGMNKKQFVLEFIGMAILMGAIFFMPVWLPAVGEPWCF